MPRLPFNKTSDFMREREFGQKIEATFDFIRAHYRPFGKCLLYIVLPVVLLTGIANGLTQMGMKSYMQDLQQATRAGDSVMEPMLRFMSSPTYLLVILLSILTGTVMSLTVYGYLLLRMDKPAEEEVTVVEVWNLVKSRLLSGIGVTIGMVALLVLVLLPLYPAREYPGIFVLIMLAEYVVFPYLMVTLSLFFIIWMREQQGFVAALRRSFYLIWGKWWSTFGLLLVMSIIIGFLSFFAMIPQYFMNITNMLKTGEAPTNSLLLVASNALGTTVMLMLYPLLFLTLAFQYFNLVERRDGEGLFALVGQIGQRSPAVGPQPEDRYRPDEHEGEY
ncbi:hypothetical protein LJY25_11490 [Hymenobacter sp. BT175]|uniref:hypothetical protein n=1 Tax=Hymenobacter translucens TaxID=2886507 RepID=UPI001D0E08AB|nr:hypothetical protein [Hymenobacter translucens]MCC2547072.1 hypothetical protein [Hymenobacter translucens]